MNRNRKQTWFIFPIVDGVEREDLAFKLECSSTSLSRKIEQLDYTSNIYRNIAQNQEKPLFEGYSFCAWKPWIEHKRCYATNRRGGEECFRKASEFPIAQITTHRQMKEDK